MTKSIIYLIQLILDKHYPSFPVVFIFKLLKKNHLNTTILTTYWDIIIIHQYAKQNKTHKCGCQQQILSHLLFSKCNPAGFIIRSVPKLCWFYDDVTKWKHFPRYWPFVRGIHRSPVNSPHKGQWRWALVFSLICTRKNGWVNNREAGDLTPSRPLWRYWNVEHSVWSNQHKGWCACPRK